MENVGLYICRVVADFRLKFSNFRYHGNNGHSRVNIDDTVKLADSENPSLVQESRLYLVHKPSYSKFCVQKRSFGYHGNNGRSGTLRNANFRILERKGVVNINFIIQTI